MDDGDICPEGVVNAIKDHTGKNTDHFGQHHGNAQITINYCVEVEDFDYVGDGYLERIIKVYVFEFQQKSSVFDNLKDNWYKICDSLPPSRLRNCRYKLSTAGSRWEV